MEFYNIKAYSEVMSLVVDEELAEKAIRVSM